jgi:CRISPR system Cascade subunit CasD
MNRTLLMRLDGPIQAWCEQSTVEGTPILFPNGSALTSVIATAMECWRDEDGKELAFFCAAVRADDPGRCLDDPRSAERRRRLVKFPQRSFTVDAVFTAALSGPARVIEQAAAALARPRRQVVLGHRCCPPAAPILLGLSDLSTLSALLAVPYQGHRSDSPDTYPVAMYTRLGALPPAAPADDGGPAAGADDWVRTMVATIPRSRGADVRSDVGAPTQVGLETSVTAEDR